MPKAKRGSGWLPGPWLYVLNRYAIPLVPFDVARRFSAPIADAVYLLWRSKRAVARRNYARILGVPVDDPATERMAHECFRQFGRYIAEMIHVQGWDNETVLNRLRVEGEEHFAEAEAAGKGIIFASAHMGSTEVAASIVVLRGYKITSVAEQLKPDFVMDWVRACRARMGITLLPVQRAGIKLLRALRRQEMVAFVVDVGAYRGGGVPITFLGQRTVFPEGPVRLARLSGAPIVFGLAARRPGGQFVAHISPPLFSDRGLDPDEDAARLTQQIADIFESYVRRYPEQWYVFREMWPVDGAGAAGPRA